MVSPVWASIRAKVASWDDADEFAATRPEFDLRDGVLHCDGTGVGPRARTHGDAQDAVSRIAPLVGADHDEITLADSASMNAFSTLLAAARLRTPRPVLVLDSGRATADRYLARSAADFADRELRWWGSAQELGEVLDDRVAVVSLSHTDPVTGGVRDAARITAEVHAHGALVVWDVTGSAGALQVDLTGWDADFAVGCGDKFLGGGPDAPAFTMVARRHHESLTAAGGRGGLSTNGVPHPAARATPTLSTAGLVAGLTVLDGIDTTRLRQKTNQLVRLFLDLLDTDENLPIEVLRPEPDQPHGAQVTVRHADARGLARELFARGVVVDHLEPDLVRFAFAPTWLSYGDVLAAAEVLHDVLGERASRSA